MFNDPVLAGYLLLFLLAAAIFLTRKKWRELLTVKRWDAAAAAGLTQPASLPPIIGPSVCIGGVSCASACPEGDVPGLINGGASALEAAIAVAEQPDKDVTIACRYEAFFRAKEKNRERIDGLEVIGNLQASLNTVLPRHGPR